MPAAMTAGDDHQAESRDAVPVKPDEAGRGDIALRIDGDDALSDSERELPVGQPMRPVRLLGQSVRAGQILGAEGTIVEGAQFNLLVDGLSVFCPEAKRPIEYGAIGMDVRPVAMSSAMVAPTPGPS